MTSAAVRIEPMRAGDWDAVRAIYLEGIASGDATFETDAPAWEAWDAGHATEARIVARDASDCVVGWAALARVSQRAVYAGVAEHSVYVAADARGLGAGTALLEALIAQSEAAGIWMLVAGIFPENVASVRLHERCGFRLVGRRERIGRMAGRWRDTLLLERRSRVAGAD